MEKSDPRPVRKSYRLTEQEAALLTEIRRQQGWISERAVFSLMLLDMARALGIRIPPPTDKQGQ